jgi:type II secretory ATPase GspE/PulE/Tfp pilus assembly ATPase PilB-like protein
MMADVEPPATPTGLPISPIKLILLLAWFYLCLYLVQRLEHMPLVPARYRALFSVISLFAGPLVFFGLVLADTRHVDKNGNPFANLIRRLRDAFLGALDTRDPDDDTLRLFDSTGTELSEIYGHGENRAADRRILDLTVQIIDNALQQRASDILIDPKDPLSYTIRLRIDGTLRVVQDLPAETCRAIINSIKAVSNMDISERRRPQDGAFTARKGETSYSFRVASAGALNGEKVSIRVLNSNAGRFTMADAGIPDRQRAVILSAIRKPSGMILVCGPTGSGKTSTLYAMLNEIDRFTHNVITVEDPIEAYLPEASQIEINTKADITFAKALRSILRQDPDVICIGEIRDEETAEIALRAAQTGHLVLATIHCDSNATALIRLLDLGISPMLLSAGLNLLLSQRLIRRLCPHCKKPVPLTAIAAQGYRQSGIDPKNLFQPDGCERCGGTGYFGRMAICDLLAVTDQLRTEIANDATIAAKLRADAEKRGRSTLGAEAIRLVNAGITSIEELKRVVG